MKRLARNVAALALLAVACVLVYLAASAIAVVTAR